MNDRSLRYMYSFKCEDDLEQFGMLPDDMQANIERYIVQVICDSFIEPADEDYVTARLLAQKGMFRAFFWAASQALEKYLKAFLLMRGVSVNQERFKGHPIGALYHEACLVDAQLLAIDTKPHPKINIHPNVSKLIDELSAAKFIDDIESQGSPDSRYNCYGVDFNSGLEFALDSFVFGLRQHIGVPPIQETLRKIDRSLLEGFNLYNPWFAPEQTNLEMLPNPNFKLISSGSVTTLDVLTGKHAPHGSKYVLHWLDKKMKLPGKVRQHLKGAL